MFVDYPVYFQTQLTDSDIECSSASTTACAGKIGRTWGIIAAGIKREAAALMMSRNFLSATSKFEGGCHFTETAIGVLSEASPIGLLLIDKRSVLRGYEFRWSVVGGNYGEVVWPQRDDGLPGYVTQEMQWKFLASCCIFS